MQILVVTLFFRMVPTIIETVLVCSLFGKVFSPLVSGILLLTLAAYVIYSVQTIGVREKGVFVFEVLFLDLD